MFFSKLEYDLTNDEKIDYIYRELKKGESDRKWSRFWRWFWIGSFIVSTYWFYLHPDSIFGMAKSMIGTTGNSLQGLPTDLTGTK